jgi:hypothetical protein
VHESPHRRSCGGGDSPFRRDSCSLLIESCGQAIANDDMHSVALPFLCNDWPRRFNCDPVGQTAAARLAGMVSGRASVRMHRLAMIASGAGPDPDLDRCPAASDHALPPLPAVVQVPAPASARSRRHRRRLVDPDQLGPCQPRSPGRPTSRSAAAATQLTGVAVSCACWAAWNGGPCGWHRRGPRWQQVLDRTRHQRPLRLPRPAPCCAATASSAPSTVTAPRR